MYYYINFSFDFLSLENVDFENYFVNELIKMGRFLSHLNARISCFIRYRTLGFRFAFRW